MAAEGGEKLRAGPDPLIQLRGGLQAFSAYVDKDDMKIRKIEGNPLHPASRGRNCAKGWVTLNQVYDTRTASSTP